ncbi:MAG: hypothetical protein DRP63_05105 [Planctomycetota bacterium]|nr:MAG: hypothetical protein DRP63_05105 [Planctomycetota bacterium]
MLDARLWIDALLKVHSSLQVRLAGKNIMESAKELLSPDSGSLMLYDRKKRCLYVAAALNLPDDVVKKATARMGERVAGRVAAFRSPRLLVGSVERYPEFEGVEGRGKIRVSICVPLVSDATVLGVLNLNRHNNSSHTNYTEEDLHAAALFAAHATLALKNAWLADTLLKQNRMLKEVDAARAGVISELVHDMRGALGAIRSYADNLVAGVFGDLTPQQEEKVGKILEQVERLGRLLDEVGTSGRRELRRELTSVNRVVQRAVEATEYLFDKNNIAVENRVPGGLEAYMDVGRMEQVLVNVLSNAAKYSGSGATVTVDARKEQDFVEIVVSDTGPGIPRDKLEKIFEEHYRLDEHADIPGSGLGLAIAKRTIEAHGGRIWAESPPDGGSVFHIRIPVR